MEYMNRTGFHQFPKKLEQKSPWDDTYNMSFFKFFEKNEDQRRYFDDYMAVRRKGLLSWHEVFPMASHLVPGFKSNEPEAVLLVDVGGNWGHELQSFHQAHADAPGRLILQDLPIMTDKFGGKNPAGIEVMTYDFFTPQPVKGEQYPFYCCTQSRETRQLRSSIRCSCVLFPQHLPRLAGFGLPTIPIQYGPSYGSRLLATVD